MMRIHCLELETTTALVAHEVAHGLLPSGPRLRWAWVVLAATLWSMLMISSAGAGVVPGAEIPLGVEASDDGFDEYGRAVTSLADGGFATVWLTVNPSGLRMQWLDSEGHPRFEPNGRLVLGAGDLSAGLAADPSGGAFVVFRTLSGGAVVVQSFDSAGMARWPGSGVAVGQPGNDPLLLSDNAGGVFVCFEAADSTIRCQHLDAQGTELWASGGIEAGGDPGTKVLARGVLDGSGGLLVFWHNFGDPTNGSVDRVTVEGQRFAGNGATLWGAPGVTVRETNILEDPLGFEYTDDLLEVVPDGSGGAVMAFNDQLNQINSSSDVMAQRVDGAGAVLWGNGVTVAAGPSAYSHETTISTGDGGAVVVVYEDIDSLESRLVMFRLDASGQHLWTAAGVELSEPSSGALDFGAFGSFDGSVLTAVWSHQLTPLSLEVDVQMARFTAAGTPLDPPSGINLTAADDLQFCQGLATSPATGRMLLVWDDRRSGDPDNFDVYGLQVSPSSIFADGFETGDTSAWRWE